MLSEMLSGWYTSWRKLAPFACLLTTVPSRRQELAAHTPEVYYRLANPTLTAGIYSWQPHPPQRYNQ